MQHDSIYKVLTKRKFGCMACILFSLKIQHSMNESVVYETEDYIAVSDLFVIGIPIQFYNA